MSLAEAHKLCELIQLTTQLDPHRKPGPQLAELVYTIFDLQVAILDADLREVYHAGESLDNVEEVLQSIYVFESASEDREKGLVRRVLRMGKLPIGALLLRGEPGDMTADAIASVIAVTFDRFHALANESRTESARRTEQLRTTVLDSLAHAYKTPLTAIQAASSGLAAMGGLSAAQAGLVSLIEQETEQLNRLTTTLLKTASLDDLHLAPEIQPVAVAPLIDDVVASVQQQLSHVTLQVLLPENDVVLECDRNLMVSLLTQYLDNAGKYADAGTTVTMAVEPQLSSLVFSVRSYGAVIPTEDLERVFDRYYRSPAQADRASGTGVGLSVAKRAAQAHGGDVWVTSDAVHGTTFCASLPLAPGEATA